MQKKLIALAIAGMASSVAYAQTNVTVYGILDAYYSYNSIDTKVIAARTNTSGAAVAATNTKHADSSGHSIGSGGLSGSRLGFRGTEDLGGGLKANFVLEYAVQNDLNSPLGLDFSANATRQAAIGLEGNWGKVNVGRLQTAAYDWDCTTAPLAGSGLDAKSKLAGHTLLSCGAGGRVNNAVAYNSPNFSGFTFAVNHARITENQAGVGNYAVPAANTVALDNDAYANMIAGGYNNGPLAINAVWTKLDNGAKPNGTAFVMKDVTEWGVSGSYNFGVVKVFAAYQDADQTVKSTTVSRSSDNSKWTLGAAAPIGANGSLSVQYADASLDRCTGTLTAAAGGVPASATASAASSTTVNQFNNGCDSDAWTIAYTHNLSKRTTLYAGWIGVDNERNSQNAANSQFKTDVSGDASTFIMGARHSF